MLKILKKYKTLVFAFLTLSLSLFAIIPAEAQSNLNALLHQANDPVAGNPRGKITVVEFFDYQCSHCIDMAPVMLDIIKANPDVRVVFKEFPIRGYLSDEASLTALAANEQGKYLAFSHALLTVDRPLSEELILETAKKAGLQLGKLKQEKASKAIIQQLESNRRLGQSLKISGTPAFYLGKTDAKQLDDLQFLLGGMSQSDMQAAIDKVK